MIKIPYNILSLICEIQKQYQIIDKNKEKKEYNEIFCYNKNDNL
jgi:hypothetical protein